MARGRPGPLTFPSIGVRLFLVLLATAGCARRCGGLGGSPPQYPPVVKGPDGKDLHVLSKGPYKAFYDAWGRLQRIEYDSNGDGKVDTITHHAASKTPQRIDADTDFDGHIDRWEEYDDKGAIVRVGASRRGGSVPDLWMRPGPDGQPVSMEYDDDKDGKPERWEHMVAGRPAKIELDSDRDGRPDRWQTWDKGRMVSEEIDTDRDGRADQRVRFDARGKALGMERLGPK